MEISSSPFPLRISFSQKGIWIYKKLHLIIESGAVFYDDSLDIDRAFLESLVLGLSKRVPALGQQLLSRPKENGQVLCENVRGAFPVKGDVRTLCSLSGCFKSSVSSDDSHPDPSSESQGDFVWELKTTFKEYQKTRAIYYLESEVLDDAVSVLKKVRLLDMVRAVPIVLKSFRFGAEFFSKSNVLSKWIGIPIVQSWIKAVVDGDGLRIEYVLGQGLEHVDLILLDSLFEVCGVLSADRDSIQEVRSKLLMQLEIGEFLAK